MEERAEAAESAARRAAQEPEQKAHGAARSDLTLHEAESSRARTPHDRFLLFDSILGDLAEYHSKLMTMHSMHHHKSCTRTCSGVKYMHVCIDYVGVVAAACLA